MMLLCVYTQGILHVIIWHRLLFNHVRPLHEIVYCMLLIEVLHSFLFGF